MDLNFLFEDPLPSSQFDSRRWLLMFRLIPQHVDDRERAFTLLKRMWTLRSAGLVMKRDLGGIKLVPLIDPEGAWPDLEFFNYIKEKYLVPFFPEINMLIGLIEDQIE